MSFVIEQIDDESKIMLLKKTNININVINESKYYSVFKLKDYNSPIIIFAIHFPSLMNQERADLNLFSRMISREFRKIEEEYNTNKSLVVGDFNMNPFDDGMTSVFSFNAVMCSSIASKEKRKCLHEEYKCYYNPMWHLMGNHIKPTKGTYYYSSNSRSLYWNTFDQLLLRPDLIDKFNIEELEIINSSKEQSLLTDTGIPNSNKFSDHLPLKFNIDMEGLI